MNADERGRNKIDLRRDAETQRKRRLERTEGRIGCAGRLLACSSSTLFPSWLFSASLRLCET